MGVRFLTVDGSHHRRCRYWLWCFFFFFGVGTDIGCSVWRKEILELGCGFV